VYSQAADGLTRWTTRVGDALVEAALRRLRRQSTWVGVVAGISAVAAAILAVASLGTNQQRHAVERAWLAVGLIALSVTLTIVVSVL
jgi:hypothetical protein